MARSASDRPAGASLPSESTAGRRERRSAGKSILRLPAPVSNAAISRRGDGPAICKGPMTFLGHGDAGVSAGRASDGSVVTRRPATAEIRGDGYVDDDTNQRL